MSELIIVDPNAPPAGPTLGLSIISTEPVQVFRETPTSPVIVTGSPERDVIQVANFSDTTPYIINAGVGDDQVTGGAGNDQLAGEAGNDFITAGAGNDRVSGGDGDDTLIGGVGSDQMNAGDGIDVIDAGAGNDRVEGSQGNDTLLAGPGNDQVNGSNGEDNIRGGDGRDILAGGAGSDFIRGGKGNDVLIPGTGRDTMKGGFDRDTFRFTAGSTGPGQLDRITDFNGNLDRIELSRALIPGSGIARGSLGDEDFAIVSDLDTDITQAVLVYEQKSGIVYYNPADGQNVPLIQLQQNLSNISADNFTIL